MTRAPPPPGTLRTNDACRVCRGRDLTKVLSLGPQPLANSFLRAEDLAAPEPFFPLDVWFCGTCGLVQLRDVVAPEVMFKHYLYASSTSPAFVEHMRGLAQEVAKLRGLRPGDLAVDIGSNDGILLRHFKDLGARVLGVDPAENIAALATKQGLETWPRLFDLATARDIVAQKGPARVITACNVFAHVDDVHALLEAVKAALEPDGAFVIEVPYLVDLLDQRLFDTVYHEHLSYFALAPLVRLMRDHGLEVVDVRRVPSHGGSLRVTSKRQGAAGKPSDSVAQLQTLERDRHLASRATYEAFARAVEENKRRLRDLLAAEKARGRRIAGYGAPAKGNTLLNTFGIGTETLEYIVDDSPLKQGLHTPGTHIPVVPASQLQQDPPDDVLILAWNFAGPILERLAPLRARGVRCILPVPEPRIVEPGGSA